MKIGSVGYNYIYNEGFSAEALNGVGCGLLLILKTPAIFEIEGEVMEVSENSYILFTPSTSHKYRDIDGKFGYDWIYLSWDNELDPKYLAELGISVDVPVKLKSTETSSEIMRKIAYEFNYESEYKDRKIALYLELLLLTLKENTKPSAADSEHTEDKSISADIALSERLLKIRNRIYSLPEEIPSVLELSTWSGLTLSGFEHAYKRYFGVSAKEDIQCSRFEHSKELLRKTTLPLRDIAAKCGYESEFSFMRGFKKRFGLTPTAYRTTI